MFIRIHLQVGPLPQISSLSFFEGYILSLFEAHSQIFSQIWALFTLIMWPRSSPPPAPLNPSIPPDFFSIYRNSVWQCMGKNFKSFHSIFIELFQKHSRSIQFAARTVLFQVEILQLTIQKEQRTIILHFIVIQMTWNLAHSRRGIPWASLYEI